MDSVNELNSAFTKINLGTPYYPISGSQENIGLDDDNIDISRTIFHSKLSTEKQVRLNLDDGYNLQLKKLTLVYKEHEDDCVIVHCLSLPQEFTRIVFSNIGDSVLLIFTNNHWYVLETLNIKNPELCSPTVS